MRKESFARLSWVVAVLLLALPLLLRISVLLATPHADLFKRVDFIYDDGYYYLSIAANLADLGRSTFDGMTATNGYQPLWLLVLALWAKLVGTEPAIFFVASCALIYAVAAATPLIALRWWNGSQRYLALFIAAGMAVIVLLRPIVFIEGLEPLLIAPLAITLVVLIERNDTQALLPLSAVLALAFLVRLDALALYVASIICLPLFELVSGRLRMTELPTHAFKTAVKLSTFVIPTVAVYLLVNQWLFGTPVPVSGLAKVIGGATFSNWGILGLFFSRFKAIVIIIALVLLLEVMARWLMPRAESTFYRSLSIISLALGLQYFYYAAFSAWNIWPWYTYLVAIGMAVLVARILFLATFLYTHPRARLVGISAALLVGAMALNHSAAFAYASLPAQVQHEVTWLGALWNSDGNAAISFNQVSLEMVDEFFKSQPHAVIAMGDRAGGLSFWGRDKVSIVQTEGLTLDVGYLKARAANTGNAYLEQFPIQYWVIDREIIPTFAGADGATQFVIADPIQGRVTTGPVPTFCFPASAVRYKRVYPTARGGNNTRIAFAFAERTPCSEAALAMMRSIEQGIGLRQYSLPTEYAATGVLDKRTEDRDRHYRGDAR